MNPEALLRSIYLGDRSCKSVLLDSWEERVAIKVDVISRLRPGTRVWDYFNGGDIRDRALVFKGVRSVRFDPPGPVPNDLINAISATILESEPRPVYRFAISIGSVDAKGQTTEVVVTVDADDLYLEDPDRPGLEVREQ